MNYSPLSSTLEETTKKLQELKKGKDTIPDWDHRIEKSVQLQVEGKEIIHKKKRGLGRGNSLGGEAHWACSANTACQHLQ